ncbi:hypothetical protein RIF29_24418 [Crotalaria pallida]|uniref:BHLH domain-containing protein n=1 Tax=Crotalaria pallida TaxID=3830 RepID=A0AAN9ELY5_CROPI
MCLPEEERDRVRDMALEAMIYPQQPPQECPFGFYGSLIKENLSNYNNNNNNNNNFNLEKQDQDQQGSISTFLENHIENNYPYEEPSMLMPHMNIEVHDDPSSDAANTNKLLDSSTPSSSMVSRPKRRRVKSRKNKEEIENQRMTHIAVERNRRKQMNEYLSVLRFLMPESYVQRGDQASIIGGAINFVKELEQRLQFLGSKKQRVEGESALSANMPFSEFFTFPQYSSTSASGFDNSLAMNDQVSEVKCGIADIEVTMVETHANLKIRSKKRPKQLLKIISSLHGMHLTILHLNVTTTGEIVLYCLSVKMEEDCNLGSVDEIAAAVYQMLDRIQQEAMVEKVVVYCVRDIFKCLVNSAYLALKVAGLMSISIITQAK